MPKRRTIPDRLLKLVTIKRKRELRPHEIAQYAVNIARRFPDFHNQQVDVDCANNACLVGWCEALIAKQMPRKLNNVSLRRRINLLGGDFDDLNRGNSEVEMVAQRLRVDYSELLEHVYNEFNSERAIKAFCELTGAVDPGTPNASAA